MTAGTPTLESRDCNSVPLLGHTYDRIEGRHPGLLGLDDVDELREKSKDAFADVGCRIG